MNINKLARILHKLDLIWLPLSYLLVVYGLYQVFMVVPSEKTMGAVQRIFYFHVASAMSAYLAFAAVFICSILFLVKKKKIFDLINQASAEVGFLFCSVVLFTGMIWGKAAWNTWFRFEPRLVSFLLIWLIFLVFCIMRAFAKNSQVSVHSAILGILGSVTVPVMVYSIKLLPAVQQLHPEVVARQGLHPSMTYTLVVSIIALLFLLLMLLSLRIQTLLLKERYVQHA